VTNNANIPPPIHALATALKREEKREEDTKVTILAQARGSGVEPLLKIAQIYEIPVIQDFTLSHKLSTLPPGAVIPDSIFKALTTVLDFMFMQEEAQKARDPNHAGID
jgi:type III secretion system FlhB-like substrate exporter